MTGPKPGLRTKTLLAAFWSLIGSGGAGLIRFISNLVLTRLLYPEAFGMMATAMLVMTLVQLFSDTGIKTALIQNPKGETTPFINTAFIIGLVRSAILFIILILSINVITRFYAQPDLKPILLIMSLAFLAEGLINPALPLLIKKLRIEKQVMYSIGTQFAGFVTTIFLVFSFKSVEALAIGYVLTSFYRVIGSYLVIPYRPRLNWDRDAGVALLHFGKYIIFNTMIGWAVLNVDKMAIGKLLGMEQLGYYNIALFIGVFISEALVQVFAQSYLPAVSTIADQLPKVQEVFEKANTTIIGLVAPFVMLLALFSNEVISILYDPRYMLAGTVLSWISLRSLFQIISNLQSGTLLALGRPATITISNATGFAFLILTMPSFITKFGLAGCGMAVVGSSLVIGLVQSICMIYFIKFKSRIVLLPWLQTAAIMVAVYSVHGLLQNYFNNSIDYNLSFIMLMLLVTTFISLVNIGWFRKRIFDVKVATKVA